MNEQWTSKKETWIPLFCFCLHGFFSLPLTYPVLAGCLVCYPRAPSWQLLSVSAWHCTDHTPGVTMSAAMVCTVCSEDITDRAMKAGERLYHEHHFTCSVCGMSLADPGKQRLSLEYLFWQIIFSGLVTYTKHDKLYCQDDYMKQFVPVCAKCDQYITQVWDHSSDLMSLGESSWNYVRNVSKPWRRAGIRSTSSVWDAQSSSPAAWHIASQVRPHVIMTDVTSHYPGGAAYCDQCYAERILPKCFGCHRPITDRALKALDAQWHVECFVCEVIVRSGLFLNLLRGCHPGQILHLSPHQICPMHRCFKWSSGLFLSPHHLRYIWRLKVTRFIVIFAFVFRSVEQHLRILKTSTQLMESLNVLSVQVWRSDAGPGK